jgi:hypothetical protein
LEQCRHFVVTEAVRGLVIFLPDAFTRPLWMSSDCSELADGWRRSHFSFSNSDEGAPHLASEMWVSAKPDTLLVLVHQDSISTDPV